MRVSYAAAVVVALLQAGMHFGFVAGISAGSPNAASYNRTREELLELERTDRARIFPTGYITGNGEKKVTRPARAYADGRTQELPAWREWLAG